MIPCEFQIQLFRPFVYYLRGFENLYLSVEFSCDAYILGFMGYGLILGMDGLSSCGAILDF